ncbi:MAG: phage tail protein [Gammaproteobacteria bacterium]
MTRVDLRLEARQVSRFLRNMSRGRAAKATARALNKMATQVRTEASKGVRKHLPLKASTVRPMLQISKASPRSLVASIDALGNAVSLKEYGARPVRVRTSTGDRQGVSVKATRRSGRKVVPGGFIGPGGHVYTRTSRARLPIEKKFGPFVSSAFLRQEVERAMRGRVRARFGDLLAHEVNREIRAAL